MSESMGSGRRWNTFINTRTHDKIQVNRIVILKMGSILQLYLSIYLSVKKIQIEKNRYFQLVMLNVNNAINNDNYIWSMCDFKNYDYLDNTVRFSGWWCRKFNGLSWKWFRKIQYRHFSWVLYLQTFIKNIHYRYVNLCICHVENCAFCDQMEGAGTFI